MAMNDDDLKSRLLKLAEHAADLAGVDLLLRPEGVMVVAQASLLVSTHVFPWIEVETIVDIDIFCDKISEVYQSVGGRI